MPPPDQLQKAEVTARILHQLSETPYACVSLTPLASGTTNFVFRGALIQPFPSFCSDASVLIKTVIIKHSTGFASVNTDLHIDVSRCVVEVSMLNALGNFPVLDKVSTAKVPHLYFFEQETNTQVLKDIPGATDLKTLFVSPTASEIFTRSVATSIGRALGSWLRAYHSWTSAPSQATLRAEIGDNEPMRKLKLQITYDSFINVLENFPEVLRGNKKRLEEVKDFASREFKKTASDEQGDEWGIIHGDFWTGNVLLPETQHSEKQETNFFIVDWEFAQFGHRAYDIGQMIGDLYERKHFKDVEGAVWAVKAFIEGYGTVSEEVAFRAAIHTGVHLITWVTRGPPLHMRPTWATREKTVAIVELGMTFILKGWEKDREYFENSFLEGLFRGN